MHQMRGHARNGIPSAVKSIRPRAAVDVNVHKARQNQAPAQITHLRACQFMADSHDSVSPRFNIGLHDRKIIVKKPGVF